MPVANVPTYDELTQDPMEMLTGAVVVKFKQNDGSEDRERREYRLTGAKTNRSSFCDSIRKSIFSS